MEKKHNFFKIFKAYQYFSKTKADTTPNICPTWNQDDLEKNIDTEKEDLELQMSKLVADMTSLYDYITEVSGFKEAVRSDIQLVNDLWLYTITKCTQLGAISSYEAKNMAQYLMDKLKINHLISVSEHINSIEHNEMYRIYIISGFGEGIIYPGLFWELLASMNGRAKNGEDDITISFTKKYIHFLRILGHYLQICDLDEEYEELMQLYINEFLEKQGRIAEGIDYYPDHSLLNPLIN